MSLKTKNEAGQLTAKMEIPLAAYAGEPVTVRLDDTDSAPIVERQLGAIPPKGKGGTQWEYKTKASGLQKLRLKAPKPPGTGFQLSVKAKGWLAAADANQPAAGTTLTVTIGGQCFSHVVTKKSD